MKKRWLFLLLFMGAACLTTAFKRLLCNDVTKKAFMVALQSYQSEPGQVINYLWQQAQKSRHNPAFQKKLYAIILAYRNSLQSNKEDPLTLWQQLINAR